MRITESKLRRIIRNVIKEYGSINYSPQPNVFYFNCDDDFKQNIEERLVADFRNLYNICANFGDRYGRSQGYIGYLNDILPATAAFLNSYKFEAPYEELGDLEEAMRSFLERHSEYRDLLSICYIESDENFHSPERSIERKDFARYISDDSETHANKLTEEFCNFLRGDKYRHVDAGHLMSDKNKQYHNPKAFTYDDQDF